jgi:superfamily II DNA or RNA helicase
MVAGAKRNMHGGLCLAPTRAGKTLCSIEAACRLGGSFLILVDRKPLLDQWVGAVRDHVRDGNGRPLPVGVINADHFDMPPDYPVVVAMIQTLVRRSLDRETRRAWRTLIVDECQSAPCRTIWTALERVESAYVFGLTATPDRKDGLQRAIAWTIGPHIANLERDLKAEVHFLQVPWANTKVPKRKGSKNFREPRLMRPGGRGVDINEAEKSLLRDKSRVALIAAEAMKAVRAGREVLILVRLRAHAEVIAKAVRQAGGNPGVYMPPNATAEQMRKNPRVATYGIAAKGIDFQPPPTLCIIAGPRTDVRQAVGRVLQPQAPHTPLVVDVVDGVEPLMKQAHYRLEFYRSKGFTIRNGVWG